MTSVYGHEIAVLRYSFSKPGFVHPIRSKRSTIITRWTAPRIITATHGVRISSVVLTAISGIRTTSGN